MSEKVEEVKNKKEGLFGLRIEELERLSIKLKDLFVLQKDGQEISFNLSWSQIIRTVNYITKEEILTWKSTAKEAMEAFQRFL